MFNVVGRPGEIRTLNHLSPKVFTAGYPFHAVTHLNFIGLTRCLWLDLQLQFLIATSVLFGFSLPARATLPVCPLTVILYYKDNAFIWDMQIFFCRPREIRTLNHLSPKVFTAGYPFHAVTHLNFIGFTWCLWLDLQLLFLTATSILFSFSLFMRVTLPVCPLTVICPLKGIRTPITPALMGCPDL